MSQRFIRPRVASLCGDISVISASSSASSASSRLREKSNRRLSSAWRPARCFKPPEGAICDISTRSQGRSRLFDRTVANQPARLAESSTLTFRADCSKLAKARLANSALIDEPRSTGKRKSPLECNESHVRVAILFKRRVACGNVRRSFSARTSQPSGTFSATFVEFIVAERATNRSRTIYISIGISPRDNDNALIRKARLEPRTTIPPRLASLVYGIQLQVSPSPASLSLSLSLSRARARFSPNPILLLEGR